jgi:hypothetical protein
LQNLPPKRKNLAKSGCKSREKGRKALYKAVLLCYNASVTVSWFCGVCPKVGNLPARNYDTGEILKEVIFYDEKRRKTASDCRE